MSIGGFIRRNAYWFNDFCRGGAMRTHFNDIKYILSGAKKGQKRQKEHLERLVKHVCEHSDFYKPYVGKDFYEMPVTNKLKCIESYHRFYIDRQYVPHQKAGRIHIQKTSGSTGIPFAIHQDTRKRQRRIAALKYFGEIAGYRSHESLVQCEIWEGTEKTPMQIFRENIYPVDVHKMDNETIEAVCRIAEKRHATAIMMFGGWAEKFSEYIEENPRKFGRLKVIFSGAEMLRSSVRKKLQSQLGCDVVERYANEEAGVLGQQRADGSCYYLNHANYYFELLKMDSDEAAEYGEMGRIVITDLFNYIFPLIRYDTGDVGIMQPPDEYSNGYPVLEKLYGRKMDITYTTSGEPIYPLAYLTLEKWFDCVQWQIIQRGITEYTIKISDRNNSATDTEKIKSEMRDIVGADAEVTIEFVEEIPVPASGKRKFVVCEI